MVDLKSALNDLVIDVVEPVLAERPGGKPVLGLVDIGDRQVEDLDHIQGVIQHDGLFVIARETIKHKSGSAGTYLLLERQDLEVAFPHADRQLVGHEQAPRRVRNHLTPESPVLRELPEQVAAGDVDHARQVTKNRPLCSFATARHAEQEDGTERLSLGHETTSFERSGWA